MKQAYDDAVYLMNEAECELMIAEAYARLGIPEVQANITVRKSTTALQRELSDGYVLGNLVDPGASNMNAGEYPMRLLYPTATTLYNSAAAKYVEENGNSLTKKLWWEK